MRIWGLLLVGVLGLAGCRDYDAELSRLHFPIEDSLADGLTIVPTNAFAGDSTELEIGRYIFEPFDYALHIDSIEKGSVNAARSRFRGNIAPIYHLPTYYEPSHSRDEFGSPITVPYDTVYYHVDWIDKTELAHTARGRILIRAGEPL